MKYEIIKLDLKFRHDLNDEKFILDFFKKNKPIHGLIICHGLNPQKNSKSNNNPLTLSINSINQYLETNLISPFNLCRYFIKNNKKGKIITISSLYGMISPMHFLYEDSFKHIGYCMSKSSIIMMTKYLATLYAKKFNINSVVLGGVINKKINNKFLKNYSMMSPQKRMMTSKETSGIFEYLLSEKSSYTNGGVFTIDDGWTSW